MLQAAALPAVHVFSLAAFLFAGWYMLIISLCLATIALWTATILFGRLRDASAVGKVAVPLLAALMGEFIAMFMAAFHLFLLCPVLLVIGFVCLAAKARTKTFVASSVAAMLALTALIGVKNQQKWAVVRREYPLESLAERLAYEGERLGGSNPTIEASQEEDEARDLGAAAAIEDLEDELGHAYFSKRTRTLAYAHASRVQQFIGSQGFGVGRMLRPSPSYLRLAESRSDQNADMRLESPPSTQSEASRRINAPMTPAEQNALDLAPTHRDSIVDFVNPQNYGWVKNLREVAGFHPHGFSQTPKLKPATRGAKERWRTTRLELVSLLKHEEPMAYISNRLPQMEALRSAPMRPLGDFERQALAKLKQGEPLVIKAGLNRLRMLGPIFALKQCQECHQVRKGELLGAFSYEFMRDPPRVLDEQADQRLQKAL